MDIDTLIDNVAQQEQTSTVTPVVPNEPTDVNQSESAPPQKTLDQQLRDAEAMQRIIQEEMRSLYNAIQEGTPSNRPTNRGLNSLVDQAEIIPSQQTLDQQRGIGAKSIQRSIDEENKRLYEAQQAGIVGVPTAKQDAAEANPIADPLTWAALGAVGKPVAEAIEKVAEKVIWPTHIKKIFDSMDMPEYEAQQNLYKYMKDNGILKTDALIEGSRGSDLGQFLSGSNLFATRDAFKSQEVLSNNYIKMSNKILKELKSKNVSLDSKDWRAVKEAETIVANNVQKLRKSYKSLENDYYGKVEQIAKSDKSQFKISDFNKDLVKNLTEEGIPEEAVNVIKNIISRFSKPFKDETAKLKALNETRASILVDMKKLRAKQKAAINAGKDNEAIKLETKLAEASTKLKELDKTKNELRDVRYMTTQDILNTTKLINRKIYKPGGAISSKDADELRGLAEAKNQLEEFLATNSKNQELQTALAEARSITKTRAKLFGAKDTGGEKLVLAKMLDSGNYGQITEYLTGKNAKENILYIRDVFGKDSEAYRTSLQKYVTNKIGIDENVIQTILDQRKATGIMDKVDITKAAAKISTLNAQDLAMIENSLGKQAKLDMIALKKLMTNFADLENAADKYGRGITSGKRQYVFSPDNPFNIAGRSLKLLKDAVGYHIAKTAEKVIYNQPKFRSITGAAVGETVYLANTDSEDISLSGSIASAILGGVGGYYGGKITRSMLESDVAKVSRYLENGVGKPKADVVKAIKNIEEALGGSQPKLLKDALDATNSNIPKLLPNKVHEILDDGTIVLSYGGTSAAKIKELPNRILFETNIRRGKGEGAQFYNDIFKVADETGKPVIPEGPLIDNAGYRYPIAMMKYYKENGKLPNAYISDDTPISLGRLAIEAKDILGSLKRGEKLYISDDTKKLVEEISKLQEVHK